jgi:heptosyltransferase-3
VVQNPLPCLPCEKLGCDGHLDSRSQCLDELSARQVLTAVDQALAWSRARGGQWRTGRKTGMEGDMPLPTVKS